MNIDYRSATSRTLPRKRLGPRAPPAPRDASRVRVGRLQAASLGAITASRCCRSVVELFCEKFHHTRILFGEPFRNSGRPKCYCGYIFLSFCTVNLRLRRKKTAPRAEVVAYLLLCLDPGLLKSRQDPDRHSFGQIICRCRQSKQRNSPRPTRQSPPAFYVEAGG